MLVAAINGRGMQRRPASRVPAAGMNGEIKTSKTEGQQTVFEQTSLVLLLTLILSRVSEIQSEMEEAIAKLWRTSNDWRSETEFTR
jgi:hypothetical protein